MISKNFKIFICLPLFTVFEIGLNGCASGYAYRSASSADPTIIFGDKLASHYMYVRILSVKTYDGCGVSYKKVGRIMNYSPLVPSSRSFNVPANTAIGLLGVVAETGKYGMSIPNYCSAPAIKFTPESGHSYIIDISTENLRTDAQQCSIYIQKVLNDGTTKDVNEGIILDTVNHLDCNLPQLIQASINK
jgi:hypothetical protein